MNIVCVSLLAVLVVLVGGWPAALALGGLALAFGLFLAVCAVLTWLMGVLP